MIEILFAVLTWIWWALVALFSTIGAVVFFVLLALMVKYLRSPGKKEVQ